MSIFTVHNKRELVDRLINQNDVVLDVGFWGQGITIESDHWPHRLLLQKAKEVYGIDIFFEEDKLGGLDKDRYTRASAEDFNLDIKFDVIFAGDLIEHLVNPGLFLDNVKKNLKPNGRLIISTPNAFNLFVLAGKITNTEPVVNSDHTFYFNQRTIGVLLKKCGWKVEELGFMYTLEYSLKESFKKKFLNFLYFVLSKFTPKFYETMIIVATPIPRTPHQYE